MIFYITKNMTNPRLFRTQNAFDAAEATLIIPVSKLAEAISIGGEVAARYQSYKERPRPYLQG